ncbi:MAG: metal-dependent hydrolase [Betaproteobacteria bacterium]|nr:metal-dependent hydrolase [Betaproteobacteria bacterium]
MDTLTHALSGALLARATAGRDDPPASLPRRVAAGFFAGAAPDLDFVAGFFGPLTYLLTHRGVTHSIPMLPLWAVLLAWVLAKLLRHPGGWRALYGVCALGIAIHIAGDLITSFGTMIFAPVSDWRAGIGTTFIIDLWFTGIILAGLLASAIWRRARIPAVAACLLLAGYVGFQAVLKERAEQFGQAYAATQGRNAVVTVQPRPVSPFNWAVFVSDDESHQQAHINLVRTVPRVAAPEDGFVARLDAHYQPLSMARWETRSRYGDDARTQAVARDAWESTALAFFRWFAVLPAFDGLSPDGACVWFRDLRFATPGRAQVPFPYGACREGGGGPWRAYQRLADGGRNPL